MPTSAPNVVDGRIDRIDRIDRDDRDDRDDGDDGDRLAKHEGRNACGFRNPINADWAAGVGERARHEAASADNGGKKALALQG